MRPTALWYSCRPSSRTVSPQPAAVQSHGTAASLPTIAGIASTIVESSDLRYEDSTMVDAIPAIVGKLAAVPWDWTAAGWGDTVRLLGLHEYQRAVGRMSYAWEGCSDL